MKKLLSVLLVVIMAFSCLGVCSNAANPVKNSEAIVTSYTAPEEPSLINLFFQKMFRSFINSVIERVSIGNPSYYITGINMSNTSTAKEKSKSVTLTAEISTGAKNAVNLKNDKITWSASNSNVTLNASNIIRSVDGKLISECKVSLAENPVSDTKTVIYAVTEDGGFCAKYTVKSRTGYCMVNGERLDYCGKSTPVRLTFPRVYTELVCVKAQNSNKALEEKTFVSATDGSTKTGYYINKNDIYSVLGDGISGDYFEVTYKTDFDVGETNYVHPNSVTQQVLSLNNTTTTGHTCSFEYDKDAEGNVYVFNFIPNYQLPTTETTFYPSPCLGHIIIEAV